MTDEWDWELQQNQTAYTVAQLIGENGINEGANITLDLQFTPINGADRDAFEKALNSFGYETSDNEEGGMEASIADIPFTFDAIWTHEERTTKMALSRGFQPDGWGFWEP